MNLILGATVGALNPSRGCLSLRLGHAVSAILLVALVVIGLGRIAPAQAQEGSVGVVVKISGAVTAVRNGTAVALDLGAPIFVGDRLETMADSALGVTLKDNSLLSLGPSSVFELTGFVLDPVSQNFSMGGRIINGSMVVTTGEIGKIAPENVEFETPFGVIGIRGTKFAVNVS
ncbi:MAG: FecR domain-containing protein [Alphaproteobacteria bacterium]